MHNLLTNPAVKRRVGKGTLFLHGWHYDIEKGNIANNNDEMMSLKHLFKNNQINQQGQ